MSAMKFTGLFLLLASTALALGMAGSTGAAIVLQEMVSDWRWLIADAGVVAGVLLLLVGGETVRCNRV